MANCHKLFLSFNNTISLGSDYKKSLRKSREAIRERIRDYFKEKQIGFTPKFHGQGSFMMNTIIEPLNGEFDIDDGIYFNVENEPSQSIGTFHRWIFESMENHTNQRPIDKQTCIRIVYAKAYHIDLPIYYIVEGQTPYLGHKGKGWIESDPREFIKWFNEKSDQQGQLKRIVRYLKAWSDYRKGTLPSGLIFSILVANHIIFNERDDVALYKTLVSIKDQLDRNFACERPTTPVGENLLEEYRKSNKDYFFTQLDSFIASAKNALDDETSLEDACKAWRYHLGEDRFPLASLEKAALKRLCESSVADGYIEHEAKITNSTDTEDFIQRHHTVSLQYDVKINCRVSQKGFMIHFLSDMLLKNFPLLPGKRLEFYIASCSVPEPYFVKWKVRNVGEEAKKRNCIRGQIISDKGKREIVETSSFRGAHFVECYIIKNDICVAKDRIDVPIQR